MSRAQADAIAADQPTVTGSDAVPQPRWRSGFDPTRRLTHNQACVLKASNALFGGGPWAGLWSGSGGSFSEAGTTRHAVKP